MSTYDMILLEGKIAAIKATIIRMLHKFPNWSNKEIADLTGTSASFVEKVSKGVQK